MLQVPLFPGVPGGPELIIIFMMVLLVFGPVVLGVVVLFAYLRRKRGDEDEKSQRIEELEARIDELEGESPESGDERRSGTGAASGTDRQTRQDD